MELLSSMHEIKIANTIQKMIKYHSIVSKSSSGLPIVKSILRNNCNIIYFNIISSSNSILKIMAKTIQHTYFYEYDYNNDEIKLVGGIRKNVVTN
jgi:hypothetical protein